MQSLRIALGLLALLATFFLLLPAEPTLLAGRGPGEPAPLPSGQPSPDAAPVPEPLPAAPVRTVGPAPTETAALRRLAPAASGAATPPVAGEPEPAVAAPETPEAPAEAGTAVAAAGAEPSGPDYRMFARPIAVDAATLKAGEVTLLVAGVEPVAREARCAEGAQAWPCATRARTALRGWIRGRSVLCAVPPEAAAAREITAPCLLGEEDVGDWVVRNGWARAAPGSRYEAAEREAREARRGVWAYDMTDAVDARSGG